MNTPLIIISVWILFLGGGYIFLYVFHLQLLKLERKIMRLFRARTDTIPGIYEISKPYLTKHADIFRESLRLRKAEFSLLEDAPSITSTIDIESQIHHEINFVFKVCNKHPKLLKNGNFIYIRESVINKSKNLWDMVQLYKKMTKRYNSFIKIKNYSIIGLLLPIYKKHEI